MDSRGCLPFLLLGLIGLCGAGSGRAQNSQLVAIDDAGGGLPAGIASLELYDNGLYWTVYGGSCSGEFSTHASVAVLGFRSPPIPQENYLVRGCSPILGVGGAIRDDTYAYFTTPDGVQRKPVGAGLADPATQIGPNWNSFGSLAPGAMMHFNGQVYYAWASATPVGPWGYLGIERFTAPGSGAGQGVTVVGHGAGYGYLGRVKKLAVAYRRPSGSAALVPYGLALTDTGYLLRFGVGLITVAPSVSIVATGINDFAVRREQFAGQTQFELFFEQDAVWAVTRAGFCPTDAAARVITIDPLTGTSSTVHTSTDGYLSSIGLDQEYIFVSAFARQSVGGIIGCTLTGSGVIRSKRDPVTFFGAPGVDPNWNVIELVAGENLRSDGQWLYFTRDKEVRRIRNNAPAIQHDFAALGLEAVQVIQDLDNSVRLVEGKRTVVRAYARVASTTLTAPEWQPGAQLRGWRNGVELPGSPIFPVNRARVTSSGDYAVLRPDVTRSCQFELPPEWVRSGLLTLQFTVNPNLATYESGASPLANNSIQVNNISVVQVRNPCLTFASMHSDSAPNYWPWENADNFARIIERAKSLLPVADFHIHPTTERISDEKVCIRTCDVLGVPVPCGFVCNEPFNFSTNASSLGGWNEALLELRTYDGFDQNRPGCGRTHYVGAIHPATMNTTWAGLAYTPGRHMLVRMNPANGSAAFNSVLGGRTLAHELAHNLGRRHVNQTLTGLPGGCNTNAPANPDMSYPHDGCAIAPNVPSSASTAFGFDVLSYQAIPPTGAGDLLSYAFNRWPSVWSYNAMLNAMGPVGPSLHDEPPPPPPGPYLLVRGIVDLVQNTVRLRPCLSLEEGIVSPEKLAESFSAASQPPGHAYVLRKLDTAGVLIEEIPLVVETHEDGDPMIGLFHQYMTKPANIRRIEIRKGAVLLAASDASPSPPVMAHVSASYDADVPALRIAYVAVDADNDPLRFQVQFSNDDGVTWRALRINEGSFSFNADPGLLPGGPQCRVRVIAGDGFHTATAVSEAFALPTAAPQAFIGGLVEGQKVAFNSKQSLLGFAIDAEDGSLPIDSLVWNLTGPTPRHGTGAALPLHDLAPGSYVATLSAQDSSGNPGSKQLGFDVLALVVHDGPTPVVDGEANDAAYASATAVTWPPGGRATARLVHSAGHLYVALTDLSYRGTGAQAAVAGLRVDLDASGETTPQSGDRGFFVTEEGGAFQMSGNGAIFAVNNTPPTGFKAVITRGPSGWNAEFQIADTLLGGWDHAVGLLLEHSFLAFDVPTRTVWPPSASREIPLTWAPAWLGTAPPEPANLPPVAVATAPAQLDLSADTQVTLNGSASFDPEGAALTFAWTQLDGPPVTLRGADTAAPTFPFGGAAPTTFRFQLVVNDGLHDSAPVEVTTTLVPVVEQVHELPPATAPVPGESGAIDIALIWPGSGGDPAQVQASSDLDQWQTIASANVGPLSTLLYRDLEAGSHTRRFYRLTDTPEARATSPGTALSFDGVDDSAEVAHNAALNALPLTVSFWLKTTTTHYLATGLVNKYVDSSFNGWSVFLSEGKLRGWYFRNDTSYVWPTALGLDGGFVADDQWHHVAFVVDESGGRLHVDAVQRAFAPWSGTPGACTTTRAVQFGRYNAYPIGLPGLLEDLSIWNRAFSPFEVIDLRDTGPNGGEFGLVGLWHFDEGSGTTAADASGQDHTATLLNGTTWATSDAPIVTAQ